MSLSGGTINAGAIRFGVVSGFTGYTGKIYHGGYFQRSLSEVEAKMWLDNPYQIYQSTIRRVGATTGSTTYTEPLTALAESYAAVADIATYIAAGEAIITAGVTAAATSGASVTDVLVTQFVGRYIYGASVPPRRFITTVRAR